MVLASLLDAVTMWDFYRNVENMKINLRTCALLTKHALAHAKPEVVCCPGM